MEFRLKELRKEYGYTQSYVANYIYVSKNSYAKYESGAAEIPLDGLIKLAILYDTLHRLYFKSDGRRISL